MTRDARQRLLTWAVVVTAATTLAGLVAIYPFGGVPEAEQQGFAESSEARFPGRIEAVRKLPGVADGFLLPGSVDVSVDVRLDSGALLTVDAVDETGLYETGRDVLVAQITAPGVDPQFAIVDFQRTLPLIWLAVAFVLAVVALGRWQGVRALAGLAISGVRVVGVAIPALLAARPPTVVALVVAVAVMLTTLPLSHGWSSTTKAAIAGTTIALAVTVVLAMVAVETVALTGLVSEDVQVLRFAFGREIDIRGLFLAGVIIGTLGVLDDVTVSQASTVAALRRANPAMTDRAVFGEAIRVGRDHIAATVNTLFLAYAGAVLPLLILFSVGDAPVTETLTSEIVAQEIVRTVVGSLGLILAVPLTTAIAAGTIDLSSPPPDRHEAAPAPPVADQLAGTADQPPAQIHDRLGTAVGDPDRQESDDWASSLRRAYGLKAEEDPDGRD